MASACVNNIGVPPEPFSPASYGWLSPRLSFNREPNDAKNILVSQNDSPPPENLLDPAADFEFRLDEYSSAAILPADKLFSGGKLVPLHFSAAAAAKPHSSIDESSNSTSILQEEVKIAAVKSRRRAEASISGNDQYLFSPKAPRCSSRWREILGLKKLSATATATNPNPKITNDNCKTTTTKSLKNFLHRSSKSYSDHSLVLPLLSTKDSSSSESLESLSLTSARLSLSSSSSSGHDHDDLPRHSLDFSDKPPAVSLHRKTIPIRTAKARPQPAADSPRMNSSGKIVFQSLERSSSSPSSFNNGGPRYKHHHHHRAAMERSYSANVRVVTPVLNVPVCSLRVGFGQLFASPQKRSDPNHNNSSTTSRTHCKSRS